MPSVISTLTNSTEYCEWITNDSQMPRKGRSVVIKGGANRAQKRTLLTPHGVATIVSAEELAFLQEDAMFKKHVEGGFLKILRSAKPDADEVAKDMEPRDGTAPYTESDVEALGKRPPKVNGDVVSEITTKPRFQARRPASFAAR